MRWAGARVAATVRSKRASSGRLLLAGQAEQVDKVLMKLEPDGMVGVAVRRGEIAVIAGLEFGERVRETSLVAADARCMRRDVVDERDCSRVQLR